MEGVAGRGDVGVGGAVVQGGVVFAKVVGFDLVVVCANSFLLKSSAFPTQAGLVWKSGTYPVNLVEIVRLKHNTTNDSRATGNLHLDFDIAKEKIKVAFNSWRITLLVDDKGCSLRRAVDRAGSGVPAVKGRVARGEVGEEAIA